MKVAKGKKPAKKASKPQFVKRKGGFRERACAIFVRCNDAEYALLAKSAGEYPVATWARIKLLEVARGS